MSQTTLLLVDDSKSARFMIKKLIETKLGIKVDVAESGEDALEYLKENKPDVIFMDHLMPGMDGLETTQVIKSQPETNAIPVVLCTSNDGPEHKKNAIEHGAIDLLPKPPNIDTITKILKAIEDGATETLADTGASNADIDGLVQAGVEKWLGANLSGLINKAVEQKLSTISLITTDDVKAEIATLKAQMEKVLELKSEQAETNAETLAKKLTTSCMPSEDNVLPILSAILPEQLSPLKESIESLKQNLNTEAANAAKTATASLSSSLSTSFNATMAQEKDIVNKKLEKINSNFSNPAFIKQIAAVVGEQTKALAVNISTQVSEKTAASAIENSLSGPLAEIDKKVTAASSKPLIFSAIAAVVAIAVSIGASFVL